MTAPAASVKAHTQRGWTLFLFTGVALGLSLWAFGFSRSADAAKTTLWWFTLGTCALALSSARSPRLAGWIWLTLTTCFAIDGATQGVIRGFFGVAPQPSVIAEALAKRLGPIAPLPMNDPKSPLAAFTVPGAAKAINAQIEELVKAPGVTEVTAKYRNGDRHVAHERYDFLRPTIVHCSSTEPPR